MTAFIDARLLRRRPLRRGQHSGVPTLDWWHGNGPGTSLHLVAVTEAGEVAGCVQATDRSLPAPSRRVGQYHFLLAVAPAHQRLGIGTALYECAERFARGRIAALLYASYLETPGAPAGPFLSARGFAPLERFLPSVLDLAAFDPAQFADAVRRVEAHGIQTADSTPN